MLLLLLLLGHIELGKGKVCERTRLGALALVREANADDGEETLNAGWCLQSTVHPPLPLKNYS